MRQEQCWTVLGSPGIQSFCQAHNIKLLANLVNLANLAANPATHRGALPVEIRFYTNLEQPFIKINLESHNWS